MKIFLKKVFQKKFFENFFEKSFSKKYFFLKKKSETKHFFCRNRNAISSTILNSAGRLWKNGFIMQHQTHVNRDICVNHQMYLIRWKNVIRDVCLTTVDRSLRAAMFHGATRLVTT